MESSRNNQRYTNFIKINCSKKHGATRGKRCLSIQLPAVPSFDPSGDPNTISQRWNTWKKSFVYYTEASGITNDVQKRNTLLHLVGIETQEIFETFQDTGNTYYQAVTKLHEHFNVNKNISYERSVFRDAKQETNQSLDQFITRLRKLATYCEYGNNVNDEITDQVIHTCRSTKLQTRLLQEQDLTLEKVQNIGRIIELSIKQSKNIEEYYMEQMQI